MSLAPSTTTVRVVTRKGNLFANYREPFKSILVAPAATTCSDHKERALTHSLFPDTRTAKAFIHTVTIHLLAHRLVVGEWIFLVDVLEQLHVKLKPLVTFQRIFRYQDFHLHRDLLKGPPNDTTEQVAVAQGLQLLRQLDKINQRVVVQNLQKGKKEGQVNVARVSIHASQKPRACTHARGEEEDKWERLPTDAAGRERPTILHSLSSI